MSAPDRAAEIDKALSLIRSLLESPVLSSSSHFYLVQLREVLEGELNQLQGIANKAVSA